MTSFRMFSIRTAALASLLTGAACKDATEGGNQNPEWDSPTAQAFLTRNFVRIPRLIQAITRVLETANGQPQPGVDFTPIAGGVQGTVAADLDGDGTMESTVDAKLIYLDEEAGIDGGATLTITAIHSTAATGHFQSRLTLNSTTIFLDQSSGVINPANGPSQIDVAEANFEITPTFQSPTVKGHVDFAVNGKTGTMIFESDGQGGFRIRVVSEDFPGFTVP
jgi:hypothetical protein